jgi:hypothetical protein
MKLPLPDHLPTRALIACCCGLGLGSSARAYAVRSARRVPIDPRRAIARLAATRRWLAVADRQIERVLIKVEQMAEMRAQRIQEEP